MSNLPSDFIAAPKVGGTLEAANNKFSQTEPTTIINPIMAMDMAASHKVDKGLYADADESVTQGDAVLSNKPTTVVGGTPMGKK